MPSSSPTAKLDGPANIMLPPLPPALNPMETIWRFMRDNGPSNRIFKSHEETARPSPKSRLGASTVLVATRACSRVRLQEIKLQNALLRPCLAFRRAA